MNLTEQYEITSFEVMYCDMIKRIKGLRKIPRLVQKRSKRIYGMRDNLGRYFAAKYFHLPVGKYTYGYETFLGGQYERIGSFCSLASGVKVPMGNHLTRAVSTSPILTHPHFGFVEQDREEELLPGNLKKVWVGSDVWIGMNAILFPGIRIGNGAVIGAGSLVNRDVPDYAVVAGVPARIIRFRFSEAEISALQHLCWWDWPDSLIRDRLDLFYTPEDFSSAFLR